jgi:acetylornithine deacetylase
MAVTRDKSVLETLADLVRIPSVNTSYVDGTGELAVAEYIEHFFAAESIETWRQSVLENRPNVFARVPGRNPHRRMILEAHMDTVSVAGMSIDPWDPKIENGKLYGRGACDTKAGLAAMMHALVRITRDSFQPAIDVWLAATVDEEFSFRGVAALCQSDFTADIAIVAEPTQLHPVIASKGVVRWKLETLGVAAHSSKPHLGTNAIEHMAHLVLAIQADTMTLASRQHPLLGAPTCNIGVIRGGVQINSVPDRCEIEIDRRLIPGETVEGVLLHYQQLVDRVTSLGSNRRIVMHPPMLTDVPLETSVQSPPVQTLLAVLARLGLSREPHGVPFGSDASKFGALGIPSVILGPGSIDQAHTANEYVECEQVHRAVDVYEQFIRTIV